MYIKFIAIILNILLYLLLITPVLIIAIRKRTYKSRLSFILFACLATIIEVILSIIIYKYSDYFFRFFTKKLGIINYGVFISKIIFSTSSLFAVKILCYFLLINRHKSVKHLLRLNTIMLTALCIIGKLIKGTVGFYFGFPITDIIMYIISILIIYNNYKSNPTKNNRAKPPVNNKL